MKKIILISMLVTHCGVSFAQQKVSSIQADPSTKGILYYFDNIEINAEVFSFIDANKIAEVNVIKRTLGSNDNFERKVYISSKNPKDIAFLSFVDIKHKYVKATTKPVLLLVNGNFIKSTKEFKIDDNFIYKVEVEQGADFEELKNIYPNFAIVNIKTKNASQIKGERQIILRGMPENSTPL